MQGEYEIEIATIGLWGGKKIITPVDNQYGMLLSVMPHGLPQRLSELQNPLLMIHSKIRLKVCGAL